MDANEQYNAAVARCEATARDHGHTLEVWYHVSEQLHASVCVICGAMVWVLDRARRSVGGSVARLSRRSASRRMGG